MAARVSMLFKSLALPDMLPFSLCSKKGLAIRHINRPLFSTTLSIRVLRNWKVGWAKDLSAPSRSVLDINHYEQTHFDL